MFFCFFFGYLLVCVLEQAFFVPRVFGDLYWSRVLFMILCDDRTL